MLKFYRIGSALLVVACSLIGLATAAPAAATEVAGVEITFENGSGPLFNFTGYMPGDSASSWVRAQNLTASDKDITVWAENITDAGRLGDAMQLTVKKGDDVIYRDSLTDFFNGSHVALSTLGAYDAAAYVFTLEFDLLAGNIYQGKSVSFDLAVNASDDINGDDGGDSSPGDDADDDDTADDGGGDDTSDDDSSDDDTAADDDSDDSDDDNSPVRRRSSGSISSGSVALLITNVRAENITAGSASIKWDTNLDATSQVIYSPADSGHDFDPSAPVRYGYDILYPADESRDLVSRHAIDLDNLKACQAYYYRVISRAASPAPSISEEYWFTTACPDTGAAGSGGGASRREVLGVSTAAEIQAAGNFNTDKAAGQDGGQTNHKAVAPLMAGSLWDVLGGMGADAGFDSCAPNVPWWLFLFFAVYPIYKSRSRFSDVKKAIDQAQKKFFYASGRAWIYSSFLPVGLAVWACFARHCLPWWPFIVLLAATIVGYEYDRRKAVAVIEIGGSKKAKFDASSSSGNKPAPAL